MNILETHNFQPVHIRKTTWSAQVEKLQAHKGCPPALQPCAQTSSLASLEYFFSEVFETLTDKCLAALPVFELQLALVVECSGEANISQNSQEGLSLLTMVGANNCEVCTHFHDFSSA